MIKMMEWGGEENAAMKGYILKAVYLVNRDKELISQEALEALFSKLHRACDEMTADEALKYYCDRY